MVAHGGLSPVCINPRVVLAPIGRSPSSQQLVAGMGRAKHPSSVLRSDKMPTAEGKHTDCYHQYLPALLECVSAVVWTQTAKVRCHRLEKKLLAWLI